MPEPFNELLRDHIRRSKEHQEYVQQKLEELCDRVEAVEVEVMGQMGDSEKPSIRSNIGEIRTKIDTLQVQVEGLQKAEEERKTQRSTRDNAIASAAISGMGLGLVALVKSFFYGGGSHS